MEFRSLLLEILIPHPLLSSHVLKDENTKNSGYETHPFSFQAFLASGWETREYGALSRGLAG